MWALEYEVDELQHKFADSIGKMDLDNLDVDFIEDMMLKAKPLQTVLNDIRNRQIVSCVLEKLRCEIKDISNVSRFQSPVALSPGCLILKHHKAKNILSFMTQQSRIIVVPKMA